MLPLLGWLATGAVAGLAVRALAPDRRYLDAPRAVALGVAGAVLGGLLAAALSSADPGGGRAWVVWTGSVAGAVLAPWGFMAFAVRWESGVGAAGTDPRATARSRPRQRTSDLPVPIPAPRAGG